MATPRAWNAISPPVTCRPSMADPAAGVEAAAVHRAVEARDRDAVALEQDRAGDVRGNHPRIAQHELALLDVDPAGDPRPLGRAGEVDVQGGDAVHGELRRQHRERPQSRNAGDGHVQGDRVAERHAAAEHHRLAGAERHVVEVEDAIGDRHVRRPGLADRHAGGGERGLGEHQRAGDPADLGRGQVEPERRRHPGIDAVDDVGGQPRPQRLVGDAAHAEVDAAGGDGAGARDRFPAGRAAPAPSPSMPPPCQLAVR